MQGTGKFQGIQALRGVSVLFTVLAHLPPATEPFSAAGVRAPWFIGVSIFYGISGWIIAHVTRNDRGVDIAPFFVKRLFRLFPVLFVSVFLTIFIAAIIPHNQMVNQFYPPLRESIRTGEANLFFFSDLMSWLPIPYAYSLEGLWSISVEIKFYVVYAALLILSMRARGITLACLLITIFGFRCWLVLIGYGPALSHVFFAELFCVGAISYQFRRHFRFHSAPFAIAWLWIMSFASLDLRGYIFLLGYVGLLVSVAYVVNCAAGSDLAGGKRGAGAFVWLGERSYVLYVLHFQILAIAGLVAQSLMLNYTAPSLYNVILICSVALGMPLVDLVHRTLENGGIKAGARVARSLSKSLTAAGGLDSKAPSALTLTATDDTSIARRLFARDRP